MTMNLELCKLHHLQNKPNQQISSHSDGWSERQSCSNHGEEERVIIQGSSSPCRVEKGGRISKYFLLRGGHKWKYIYIYIYLKLLKLMSIRALWQTSKLVHCILENVQNINILCSCDPTTKTAWCKELTYSSAMIRGSCLEPNVLYLDLHSAELFFLKTRETSSLFSFLKSSNEAEQGNCILDLHLLPVILFFLSRSYYTMTIKVKFQALSLRKLTSESSVLFAFSVSMGGNGRKERR